MACIVKELVDGRLRATGTGTGTATRDRFNFNNFCHKLPKLSRDDTWLETTLRSITDLSIPSSPPAASVSS